MKTHVFMMECLTDMHVGNGEANYSIIDNEVQKDTVIQNVPIIHASGVKGALKNFFSQMHGWEKEQDENENAKILHIFGGRMRNDETGRMATKEGDYKFFNAFCLARPLRVTNGDAPYVLATSEAILEHLKQLLNGLGRPDVISQLLGDAMPEAIAEIEGEKNPEFKSINSKPLAIMNNLQDYALPVRARNILDENGLSQNLWYEELVPHKSIFLFAVIVPDQDAYYDEFRNCIEKSAVQFGGNASIGNGYTKITELEVPDNGQEKG